MSFGLVTDKAIDFQWKSVKIFKILIEQCNNMKKNIKNLSYMFCANGKLCFPINNNTYCCQGIWSEKLGLINYIAAIVGYFSLVVSYSFNFTGVRRVTRENSSNQIFSTIFTSQMLLISISMAIFAICIFTIGDLKNNIALALITLLVLVLAFTQTWFCKLIVILKPLHFYLLFQNQLLAY